jgi:hypothetical protein
VQSPVVDGVMQADVAASHTRDVVEQFVRATTVE